MGIGILRVLLVGEIRRQAGERGPVSRQILQRDHTTAAFGHFGRTDVDFTWEKTDKAAILKQEAGL